MSQLSPETLEGRLNAHREVLAIVLDWMMRQPDNDIAERISQGLIVQDHEEDPGVLPDPAFAIGGAAAVELQLLLDRARMLRAASQS